MFGSDPGTWTPAEAGGFSLLSARSWSSRWYAWAALLVSAYLVVAWVGWQRTLIGTEVWALYHAGQPFTRQLQSVRNDLVHPPLMYLVERLWLGEFGQSDSAAKALALVINLPTFFLFTWLAHRVTTHWRLASFLFLSLYLKVGSTPNQVRMYGLGLLLTVAAMVLWERWRESARAQTLAAWTLIVLLLIYSHLFGALLLLAFCAANWLCGPRRWAFTFAASIPAVAFLPWLLYVLPVYESRGLAQNLEWVPKSIPVGLGILSYGLLGEFRIHSVEARVVLAFVAGLVHLTLLFLGWRVARRLWPPPGKPAPARLWFWVTALLACVPIGMLVFFSLVVKPAVHWRFVLGVLPAYWLLVVLVCQESGRVGRLLLCRVLLVWVLASLGVSFARMGIPSASRQAALLLVREQRPSDLILCRSSCNELYWELTHHLGRAGHIEIPVSTPVADRLSVVPQITLETANLAGVDHVWLFADKGAEADSFISSLSRRGFALKKEIPVQGNVLLLFSRTNTPSPAG
jgi:hypothetical protein